MIEIPNFNAAVQSAEEWVDDLTKRLDWHDRARACLALVATLHALRDCLERDEAIYLGTQLPTLLRGLYYEDWHPGRRAARKRSAFLGRIHDGVHRDPAIEPGQVASMVLALLAARLPAAEIENAKAATPSELHTLWPS